jgi:hypothetical protein
MPVNKMYMEIPGVGKEATDPEIEKKIKDMAEKRSLGKEKISGYSVTEILSSRSYRALMILLKRI